MEQFLMLSIVDENPRDPSLCLCVSQDVFEFENDYIFVFANEVSEKTTTELDNALEENMTVYVKTISGKTISIKCDKNRKELLFRMKLREDH